MKKLFTSALLTVAAVPFLVAAPAAQNASTPAAQSASAKPKSQKKHVKKVKKSAPAAQNSTAASANSAPAK